MVLEWKTLRKMKGQEIIDRFNAAAKHTSVGTGFWREELVRRELAHHSRWMVVLTAVVTAATVTNLVFVVLVWRATA